MLNRKTWLLFSIAVAACLPSAVAEDAKPGDGWVSLFDGKTLGKWTINESPESWAIEDGTIVAKGVRSHLFYMGDDFKDAKNFEFKADVLTKKGSNSGIFFHTKFQDSGWPAQGYESQVNNTHGDPVKTGSLYNTVKLLKTEAEDDKWWTQTIIVKGKHVTVKVNGKTVIEYDEPADKEGTVKLGQGTFALQAHDPGSIVKYKNIYAKPLP